LRCRWCPLPRSPCGPTQPRSPVTYDLNMKEMIALEVPQPRVPSRAPTLCRNNMQVMVLMRVAWKRSTLEQASRHLKINPTLTQSRRR
jgi:hypothetical protein